MEIKLSDEDFEKLAATLDRRISDRVIGLLAAGPAFEAMSKRAEMFAAAHISEASFASEASARMAQALAADGQKLLKQIVRDAVKEVNASDPDLRKAVAKGVYEAAAEHAERLRDEE